MKLQEITEPGTYWAIDKNGKHRACDVVMTIGGAVPLGLPQGLQIRGYVKRGLAQDEIQYKARKKIF